MPPLYATGAGGRGAGQPADAGAWQEAREEGSGVAARRSNGGHAGCDGTAEDSRMRRHGMARAGCERSKIASARNATTRDGGVARGVTLCDGAPCYAAKQRNGEETKRRGGTTAKRRSDKAPNAATQLRTITRMRDLARIQRGFRLRNHLLLRVVPVQRAVVLNREIGIRAKSSFRAFNQRQNDAIVRFSAIPLHARCGHARSRPLARGFRP